MRFSSVSHLVLAMLLAFALSNCGGGNSTPINTVTAPGIETQPAAQSVQAGQTATFAVVATGTAPLSYQWQKNTASIVGATSANYTTPPTTTSDNGSQFTVVVSNSAGPTTSNVALLTVTPVSPPSITSQPANQIVNVGEPATFVVVASGTAPLSYQWSKNGGTVTGATSASYTTPPTTAVDNGSQFQVMVSSPFGSVPSTPATLNVNSLTSSMNVVTYHNDNFRSGQDLNETVLTPQNVNANLFGTLFSDSVDGLIFTQPLYLANVTVAGGSVHNVVYVATEHDSVYAFDADSAGAPLWQVSFIDPANGITTLTTSDVSCTAVSPEVGITGTPVIDPTTGTLYLVARTKENGTFVQRLHALDVTSGAEKFGGPVTIQATVPGYGAGSVGGMLSFNPQLEGQRAALFMQNGLVYIGWASLCDITPFHGWLMAYDPQTLMQVAVQSMTPNGTDGGIWDSGSGPTGDGTDLFFATGNGDFKLGASDAASDYGSSILRMAAPDAGAFSVLDYFTPYNFSALDAADTDLGSGGVMLVDQPVGSPHQHLLFLCGKEGTIYVVDRDNMGHFNANGDMVLQSILNANSGSWSSPAWWNDAFYLGGNGDAIESFAFDPIGGTLSPTPSSETAVLFTYPGATPSISANGATNGILWALLESNFSNVTGKAVLYAYDAANLNNLLYSSSQNPTRDNAGLSVKFGVPTIANGKVYVPGRNAMTVFGLLP
ncbi:MAG TPA: immunoglobulin domain-containing protein [Candidatus Sulfotelmatobacter sp.]